MPAFTVHCTDVLQMCIPLKMRRLPTLGVDFLAPFPNTAWELATFQKRQHIRCSSFRYLTLIPLLPRNWPVPFMVRCGHGFPSRTQGTDLPLCTELLQILYIRRKPPLECHNEAHMSKTTEDDVRWSGLHNLRQPAKVK
jgi:hypothetical protein